MSTNNTKHQRRYSSKRFSTNDKKDILTTCFKFTKVNGKYICPCCPKSNSNEDGFSKPSDAYKHTYRSFLMLFDIMMKHKNILKV